MESSSAHAMIRRAALGALLLAAACSPVKRAPPPAGVPAAPPLAAAGEVHYRIDAARSDVRILAYRSGALASLGHNHVLLARSLSGDVFLPADPARAHFEVMLPVAELVVDEPAARAAEGTDFASEPSAADIEGTRRHMLGEGQLDAASYPRIVLSGTGARSADGLLARTTLRVRDRSLAQDVPLTVTVENGVLTAQGGFTVLQSALGLTPFSVALGALKVRDDLAVRFRLVALPDPTGGAGG